MTRSNVTKARDKGFSVKAIATYTFNDNGVGPLLLCSSKVAAAQTVQANGAAAVAEEVAWSAAVAAEAAWRGAVATEAA